uniref:S49 family peptidase n=1 Tax=Alloprevotella sp. TaxID=1872471 RepID=UPI0040261649
ITRNGGACSYGSIDHRDIMMRPADYPLCRGHVFMIKTPGGSAWAKNDYALAIEYAHSKGQKVIALTDGLCASAGMYLASLCDEVYYMNPKDQIGCIGVMAAFYTLADGSKNQFTDETYHEAYDPESFDKNKAYRDLANNNDDEELVKELAELGVEFRADIKKAFPNAKDEHLHGKVFKAEDVNGIFADGQSTFMGVVQRAFALFDGRAELIKREASVPEAEPQNEPESEPQSDPQNEPQNKQTATNQNFDMENYPLINAACGLKAGEIAVTEEGAYMNASLLDKLEANMKEAEQKVADAEQKATTAETALADMQGKVDELSAQVTAANDAKTVAENALAEAKEAHSKEIEELNAQHTEAIAQKDDEMNALTEAKAQAESDLKGAKDALATAEQKIADMQAQIDDLTNEAGEETNAGAAPANNGEGVEMKKLRTFDPSKYKTNVERKAAFERFKRGEE